MKPGCHRMIGRHWTLRKTVLSLGVGVGLLVQLWGRIPWLGRLPGDILVKREGFTFYFPLTTGLLLSILISFLLWLFRR